MWTSPRRTGWLPYSSIFQHTEETMYLDVNMLIDSKCLNHFQIQWWLRYVQLETRLAFLPQYISKLQKSTLPCLKSSTNWYCENLTHQNLVTWMFNLLSYVSNPIENITKGNQKPSKSAGFPLLLVRGSQILGGESAGDLVDERWSRLQLYGRCHHRDWAFTP